MKALPPALVGMDFAQMQALCQQAGVKPVHAESLRAAIYRHLHTDIESWPHSVPALPERLRAFIRQHCAPFSPNIMARQEAADGTTKLLLAMDDGREVETVLIPGKGRLTQCISTQIGCAVGCRFCLTATAGLTRNLNAAEMLSQVMVGQLERRGRVRNLVLMGMGEPLHNYDAVAAFVRTATDPKGLAFSPRRVTLSTSGMIPGIRRMIEDDLPCNLALSLNATTDEVRSELIPLNRKYPLAPLMQCLRDYVAHRGDKRVLIEYVMLAGINDSIEDAYRLVELLDGLQCTVNLLPFNPYPGSIYERPADEIVDAFRAVLVEASLVAVVRESRGREISAACGQLKTEVAARKQTAKA